MIKKWRKLSKAERLRFQILIIFGLVGLYAPFYMKSHGRLVESEKMLHRREDRIEKRTSLENLDVGGPNARSLESQIADLEVQLNELENIFDALNERFAPIGSIEVQQQLMLELSTLAEASSVDLQSVSRKGTSSKQVARGKPLVDHDLGRPMIDVEASAHFASLLIFLKQLGALSYQVSVVNLKLYTEATNESGSSADSESAGKLHIEMEMSL